LKYYWELLKKLTPTAVNFFIVSLHYTNIITYNQIKGEDFMVNIFREVLISVYSYLRADWLILLIGILIAVAVNVYVDSKKLKRALEKNAKISVPGAVLFGALTPLCACGTMAVLISMFVTAMPWGAVMAFLISSPLSSPSDYIFETAFFGSRFAIGVLISSLALGVLSGYIAHLLEMKTNFFKGQFRMAKDSSENCCSAPKKVLIAKAGSIKAKAVSSKKSSCCSEIAASRESSCCTIFSVKARKVKDSFIKRYKLDEFARQFYNIGIKKVLLYFIVFIGIGRVVEMIIPKEWIMTLFSSNKAYSIPLATTIGLPLYLNNSSALPLLRSFINAGAGEGAVLAFLIAGKATGVPVMAGMATFLKKRAMFFYISFVYFGAIICGYLYQFITFLLV
jgi:uncharacterized protein